MNKLKYIYTMEEYSAIKMNKQLVCTNMDESQKHYSEQRSPETEHLLRDTILYEILEQTKRDHFDTK